MSLPVPLEKAQHSLVSFSTTREREFYKYLPPSTRTVQQIDLETRLADLVPRTSPDSSLSAFAQLGALRLDAQRATISLFGRHDQHILTEATKTLSLRDDSDHNSQDGLWVGACRMSYDRSFCSAIASSTSSTQSPHKAVFIVPDLTQNKAYKDHPDVTGDANMRFLAHALIVSPKGIVIGAYTVLDDKPRSSLSQEDMRFLKDMGATVMDYLVASRSRDQHLRSERMLVGLGSFLEGKGSLRSSWVDQFEELGIMDQNDTTEGRVSTQQQDRQHSRGMAPGQLHKANRSSPFAMERSDNPLGLGAKNLQRRPSPLPSPLPKPKASTPHKMTNSPKSHSGWEDTKPKSNKEDSVNQIDDTFARAANIIRESLEVEGVAIFSANAGRQETFVTADKLGDESSLEGSSSDGETKEDNVYTESEASQSMAENSGKDTASPCKILGFATSGAASVNSESTGDAKLALSESFLAGLLRRYPRGKIFNFGEDGSISSDETSDCVFKTFASRGGKKYKKTRKSVLRHDAATLLNMAPGSRSIIFSPVWDSHKSKWYAAKLAWTRTLERVFTLDDEMTFCAAFGSSLIAEVHRLGALFADRAKADVLAGLSHELRSPLHGIFGTAELLNDTAMDALQRGLVHTVTSCANTLLGSINQLLEFSGINDIERKHGKKSASTPHSLPQAEDTSQTSQHGAESAVQLDISVEETLETIFAGFCFFHKSRLPLRSAQQGASIGLPGGVKVIFDIDSDSNWKFATRPGAWHVLLTNIVGNALKYTQQGHVKVSLKTNPIQFGENGEPLRSTVNISVEDTGCGMDPDFLRDGYFTAFSQEDPLLPGNGLGASIAQKTISSLDGDIKVRSQKDIGTQVEISLALDHVPQDTQFEQNDYLDSTRDLMRHKTIGILGLGSSDLDIMSSTALQRICHKWLQMDAIVVTPSDTSFPHCDFYIATHEYLDIGNLEIRSIAPDSYALFSSPTIVVCPSPRVAHSLYVAAQQRGDSDVLEFISQPCGPRKLAKSLEICVKRQARRFDGKKAAADSTTPALEATRSRSHHGPTRDTNEEFKLPPRNYSAPLQNQNQQSPGQYKSPETEADYFSLLDPPLVTTQEAERTLSEETKQDNGPPTALIVDDNEINANILVAFMKKMKIDYLVAHDGQEALDCFKEHFARIFIVLMDITMPVMDGLESTRHIRSFEKTLEAHDRVPIVALTGVAQDSVKNDAISSGMTLFLTKPVRLDTIANVIKEHTAVTPTTPTPKNKAPEAG